LLTTSDARNLKGSRLLADLWVMLSSAQILDRGRLVAGLVLVIPLGALLAPGLGREGGSDAASAKPGPQWNVDATQNPITAEQVTPDVVLANLTSRPGASAPVDRRVANAKAATEPAEPTSEVGSESEDDWSTAIEGTAPDDDLAAQLRAAQAQNNPYATSTPSATPAPESGPMPLAVPSIAAYPAPQGATHLFPIVGGATFSNDWGGPRPGGRTHQGIDLFAKTGSPVIAISDGVIYRVGWNRIGGWRFWLRDRWGNEFYHAHLSAFAPAAKEGATVTAGTVIGFVGKTGDAKTTPPHVHFEIHPAGGNPIPPFSYVSAWPRV
jgi:murein DD-endopeptidase MepM/ murein hydrolase activator NlpD